MNETDNTLSLKGYVNLLNTTNINFDNANIDFVLGDINQVRGADPYIQKETARCEIKNFTGIKLATSPTTVNGKEPQEDKTTYPEAPKMAEGNMVGRVLAKWGYL